MSWICCPCRCRRRIKTKAVHTISATIRCNGDVAPPKLVADEKDGRYVEPVSDLAQQAYKHLELVEEERRRGSRVFDQDWTETERDEVDHANHVHIKDCPEASKHKSTSSTQFEELRQPAETNHNGHLESVEHETQQRVPKELERNEETKPTTKVETTTSTEASTTQEIETQVEAKQFHEQSCQSDDLPPPQIIEIIREPEPKQEEVVDTTEQLRQQFSDLHKNLLNWLEETEELVENQKPPSADYKVVKTQLQNHDFQTKLVDDKQESFDKLSSLADSLHQSTSLPDAAKHELNDKANTINARFNALVANVHQRRQDLLDAQELANDFHRMQQPLSAWLEDASQRVSALCKVVTSKEEIEANIAKQEALKREIDSKRDTFDSLTDCYSQLVRLVGADEANELDAQVRNLTARYDELGRRCVQCGHALHGFSEDMSSFLADTDELAEWLDQIEREFERLGDLPLDGQELVALSEEFAELANAISERSASVSRIVDESREICTHTSGSEALAMSARIDRLHSRYNQLLSASMERIEVFATAIRVSDELVDLVEQMEDFMDACDDALHTLDDSAIEEQLECVESLSEELEKHAPLIEDIEEMTHQLRALSNKAPNEQQDVELIRRSDQLRHRFSATRVLVEERKRRLQMADSRGRQTFDALDFWIEFFEDALEQSARADRPPADLEQLKELMHKQRTLNERVASERAGVRDLVAEAARVARDINSNLGGEDPQLDAKIERVRKLVEETAEAGADRLAVLEQVYELCKELVPAYEELNDGMSKIESEFQKCRPIQTGQPLEELREQLEHNQQMLQLARTEKQNLAKFEHNIDAVVELCAKEDGEHLRQLCEQLRERHADIQNAFAGRGNALEQIIGDNTKFADRFAAFVKSLEAAAVHARHLDPIAARPPVLRRQMSENAESIRLWEQKAVAFDSMRSQAMDQLAQVKHNDVQVLDLSQKLATLDELWLEVRSAYDARDRQLRKTLPLAEQFWNGSTAIQTMFKGLRTQLQSLPEGGIEPASMGVLERVKSELATATPQFEALQRGAAELLLNVGDDSERSLVEQQLQLLDQEWQMLSQCFTQRSTQVGINHDKANNYGLACQSLQQWLQQADEQLQQLDRVGATEAPAIRQVIDQLQALRSALNVKALERDDLNRCAHELCLNAQPAQVAAIRTPLHAIGEHLNRLYALIGEKQHRLERSLIDLGQVEQAHAQLQAWLAGTDSALLQVHQTAVAIGDSDAKRLDLELAKLATIRRDISAHVPSFDALERVASAKSAPLLAEWSQLQRKANQLHAQLEDQLAAAQSKTSQLDKWQMWLSDVLSQLSSSKLVGALPETVATQLADLRLLVDEVEQKRQPLAHDLEQAQKQMEMAGSAEEKQWIQDRLNPVRAQWQQVQERLASREAQLKKAELEAIDLAQQIQSMSDWVEQAEHALNIAAPISRLPAEIQKQIDEHTSFVEMSQAQRATMAALSSRGLKVQMTCEKKDAIPIKNQLVSLKNRNERIAQRALEREKQMQAAKKEADSFEHAESGLVDFIKGANDRLAAATQEPTTGEKIKEEMENHRQLEADLDSKRLEFEEFSQFGRLLVDAAPTGEKKELSGRCERVKTQWTKLEDGVGKRKRLLDEALVQSGKFDEALAQMLQWLDQYLPPIEAELASGKMAGDTDTLQALIKENDRLAEEMKTKLKGVTTIRRRAEEVLAGGGEQEDKAEISSKMDKMNNEWERLEKAVDKKSHLLNDSLVDGVELTENAHELHERLNDLEMRLRSELTTSTDQTDAAFKLVQAADKFADEAFQLNRDVEKWTGLAKALRERAHPRAQTPIAELNSAVNSRWQQVEAVLAERSAAVRDLHSELLSHDKLMKDIEGFAAEKREVLAERNANCAETWTLPEIQDLIVEHSEFKEQIRSRQPDMDSIMKLVKKPGATLTGNVGDDDTKGSQANLSKSITSLSGTLPRQKSTGGKSRLLPEKQTITKRQRKADQLNETWDRLWTDTIETEDKLKERKADIEELRRLENFTFAEWRERYLAWNDSAKARISDLFRRIDKHGAGFVPRQQFIDGVLSSKFPTTRLEMEKVADEFDKNGQISSKEFMNALRYEGRNRRLLQHQQNQQQAKSDPERIHNEIKRETERCQCAHPFKINRDNSTSSTGTVRYAFGESSIKRMVRILHSTVMVRVGGGWVELASFLLKHDPCRAKGRTNLELYQGHEFMPTLTPDGAVDQMSTFQRKHSSSMSAEALRKQQNAHLLETYKQGPITKIREKTERSIPMFKAPKSVASSRSGSATRQYSRQSSDVSIKVDGSRIPRPTSTSNLAVSRPSSRASDVSDLSAVTPSRIPSIRGRKTPANGGRASQTSSTRQSPMPK